MTALRLPLSAQSAANPLRYATDRILDVQLSCGAIPWFEDGPWDAWNHTEAAMALTAMGERDAAEAAYQALSDRQAGCGNWLSEYGNAIAIHENNHTMSRDPAPAFHDTNFTAYCAVGIWHAALHWNDADFLKANWDMIASATNAVLKLQSEAGDISWSVEASINPTKNDAVRAGNASIYKSLQCAIQIADSLGYPTTYWTHARNRLGEALRSRPDRYDRSGTDRSTFAMDWYYPVLCGVLEGNAARARIFERWDMFVHAEKGCHCVTGEPWVTVAEACELVMALLSIGERGRAEELFHLQTEYTAPDGGFWMGWQYEMELHWPRERPSWTQAAVILAADALYGDSPASRVLTNNSGQSFFRMRRLETASTSSNRSDAKAR